MNNRNKSPLIFMIAGEKSADNHGASIIKEIKKKNNKINFIGIGGKKMITEGLQSIENINKLSVMGFIEVIKHLFFFKKLTKKILHVINQHKPNQIILIDYPGFNLHLAKQIKSNHNIPITYYISPQIWAWKEGRLKTIKKHIDQMLVIFPFEKDWYEQRGFPVKYVGHPIFDDWEPTSKTELCKLLQLNETLPIITLYPGSRIQEINRHLPLFLEVANQINAYDNKIQFILGLAENLNIKKYNCPSWLKIEKRFPQKALECGDLAIVASGTSTVEAAIFGTPMLIVYKMNLLSWWLTKIFVNVNYAGMVNIIANKEIMPEYLQNDAKANSIKNNIIKIINNDNLLNKMKKELLQITEKIKCENASKRAASHIMELLEKNEF